MATAASSSRVMLCRRAARLTVLPITVQMKRSDDWMLPTNAGPVPMTVDGDKATGQLTLAMRQEDPSKAQYESYQLRFAEGKSGERRENRPALLGPHAGNHQPPRRPQPSPQRVAEPDQGAPKKDYVIGPGLCMVGLCPTPGLC